MHAETILDGPSAVGDARRFVHDTLDSWDANADLDDAELIVSELATNAVRYERQQITVSVNWDDTGVWLEVGDADTRRGVPRLIAVQHAAETGRGLTIVDTLAESWGVTPTDAGKRVWAHLHT